MSFVFNNGTAAAGVLTTVRTISTGKNAIVDLNLCKTSAGEATVNISVVNGAMTSFLEHGLVITYGAPFIRTKEMLPADAILKVQSDVDIDYTLAGVEEVI